MPMPSTVQTILDSMTLEQKVGQLLVFGFSGPFPHRDIVEAIRNYHPAGFRVTPHSRKFKRYLGADHPGATRVMRDPEPNERVYAHLGSSPKTSPAKYAQTLNTLRALSMETGAGIPLYFSTDYEGNVSADYSSPEFYGVPHPMGLVASGDEGLCHRVALLVARQLKAIGIDWVHSPVLDVNTNPLNPEIGTRAYGPDPDQVARYALASLRGFQEGNVVATGKHFPGRGPSAEDAHFDVPTIPASRDVLERIHLAPYRKLIAAGLPAIMLAHSIYPSLDPKQEVATLSKAIVTDLLRGELGFQGVITTDSFTMGGIVMRYEVAEAAIRSFEAGVDLLLLKDESALRGEVWKGVCDAVRAGRLSEERVNESVARTLAVKERFGLLHGTRGIVDPAATTAILHTPMHETIAREAARKSLVVLRDRDGLLPLAKDKRICVVEQNAFTQAEMNNERIHPCALVQALYERGLDVYGVDFSNLNDEAQWSQIAERVAGADWIVHSGWYQRGGYAGGQQHAKMLSLGKPTVFVTNSPYPEVVHPDMGTVVVTFSMFVESMEAAADLLAGNTTATASLSFDPTRELV